MNFSNILNLFCKDNNIINLEYSFLQAALVHKILLYFLFMILEYTQKYSFKAPLIKVHHLFQTYGSTFLVIFLKETGKDSFILYDQSGNIIWENHFDSLIYSWCQINEKQIALLLVEKNEIWHIDLQTQSTIMFGHSFIYGIPCQCYIDYFCDSRLLCVRQHGDSNDNTITLVYYTISVNNQPNQPNRLLKPYVSLQRFPEWDPDYVVRKINTISSFIWSKIIKQTQIKAIIAQPNQFKVQLKHISISMLPLFKNPKDCGQLSILQMWEIRPKQLILFASNSKDEISGNTIIWNLKNNTVRATKFTIDPKYYNQNQDVVATSRFSMIRTCDIDSKNVNSPVYFIQNATEEIISEQKSKYSHFQKYTVPDHLSDTILQLTYDNVNAASIIARRLKYITKSQILNKFEN